VRPARERGERKVGVKGGRRRSGGTKKTGKEARDKVGKEKKEKM